MKSELFSAKKVSNVLSLIPKEFSVFTELIPINITFKGNIKLIRIVQKKYDETNSIEEALSALDGSLFPAVTNIENYEMLQYVQMKK